MKSIITGSLLALAMAAAPLGFAANPQTSHQRQDSDMQRAIRFQRAKDAADRRQARIEARRPNARFSEANRSAPDEPTQGRKVGDTGEKQWTKHVKKDQ